MFERLMGLVGLTALLGVAWLMSNNRGRINRRTVLGGMLLQFALGVLLLWWAPGRVGIQHLSSGVESFLNLSDKGAAFLFGNLADPRHFFPEGGFWPGFGFQFAFKVLPTIIFFSAFMSILYYLGVMQLVIRGMAYVMQRTMKTSGSETLSVTADIFVGQTEAPLLIRPFLSTMTVSELHTVMVGGFATIAGGVMAGYIGMGINPGHLIVASVMAAPATFVVAKIIHPETETSCTAGFVKLPPVDCGGNLIDAAARGTTDGLKLAANVGAMLVSFIALVAFADWVLGGLDAWIDGRLLGGAPLPSGESAGWFPGSLSTLFGTLLAPVAYLMGVPWHDAPLVGNLLGIKISVNEFVGYSRLAEAIHAGQIGDRAQVIATYALCGFANFSSIGIQIGGITALAPERRGDAARLGLKAMVAGTIVTCMTACIAGLVMQ
jgi:CNT family concentrative nucleoside transporter